jgi:hypothetical protein
MVVAVVVEDLRAIISAIEQVVAIAGNGRA